MGAYHTPILHRGWRQFLFAGSSTVGSLHRKLSNAGKVVNAYIISDTAPLTDDHVMTNLAALTYDDVILNDHIFSNHRI